MMIDDVVLRCVMSSKYVSMIDIRGNITHTETTNEMRNFYDFLRVGYN